MYKVFGSWLFDVVTKIPSLSSLCTFFIFLHIFTMKVFVGRAEGLYCNCFVCLCIPNISVKLTILGL